MTREQHFDLYREHQERAMAALKEFRANHSRMDKWQEYKEETKLANKHYGIAQAMYTKKMKKKLVWLDLDETPVMEFHAKR